jgi:hypothetical protein
VRDGDAGERRDAAFRSRLVGRAGARERAFGVDGDEGVERAVEPLDPRERVADELDARNAPRRERRRKFRERAYSMTFGTR